MDPLILDLDLSNVSVVISKDETLPLNHTKSFLISNSHLDYNFLTLATKDSI